MPSEFSSNIRQIAAELKLEEKRTANLVRKMVRAAITEAAADTTAKIKDAASWSTGTHGDTEKYPHSSIPEATAMRVVFSASSGGARISTSRKKAPHARPLEKGSRGSGGAFNRHPVFERDKASRVAASKRSFLWQAFHLKQVRGDAVWVNQPTRPFFYSSAKRNELPTEKKMIEAIHEACRAAGWRGI